MTLLQLLAALLLLGVTVVTVVTVPRIVRWAVVKRNPELGLYVAHVLALLLIALGLSAAIGVLFPKVSLLSVGSIGLAVGLAMQGILSNLFAGGVLVAEQRFKLGDWVIVQSGVPGQVEDVGARVTVLRTLAGDEVVVPNSVMQNSVVVRLGAYSVKQLIQPKE